METGTWITVRRASEILQVVEEENKPLFSLRNFFSSFPSLTAMEISPTREGLETRRPRSLRRPCRRCQSTKDSEKSEALSPSPKRTPAISIPRTAKNGILGCKWTERKDQEAASDNFKPSPSSAKIPRYLTSSTSYQPHLPTRRLRPPRRPSTHLDCEAEQHKFLGLKVIQAIASGSSVVGRGAARWRNAATQRFHSTRSWWSAGRTSAM
ncbi:hypothetical protein FPV67DRAFT_869894 [Lyophyllum atratum]|nr:hypothetical protein FPV67DRAFT_869894 [Lyophyllum atratum]